MIDNVKVLNMYYGDDVVNSIFIEGIDSLVIIDTGTRDEKEKFLKEIAKYKFKILYVILTHAHPDHIGNNHSIKESYDPIYIANICSKKLLENYVYQFNTIAGRTSDCFKITEELKSFYFGLLDKEVKIDISFYKKMNIDLGNRDLKLIHIPGHTIGDIGIIDKKNKLLILSELIFKHSRKIVMYIESYDKYISSLEIVKDIVKKEDIKYLITSHEEKLIAGRDNILNLIQYNIDYIDGLKSRVETLLEKKYSVKEIAKEICKIYEKEYTFDSIVTVKSIIYRDK